jgi:thioredoxin 1
MIKEEAMIMSVVNITSDAEFTDKVLKADKPVLVDFWAPWCGPCKMVGPEVEAVAQSYEGKAVVAKINVDEQQKIASQYNVMGIPTLLLFKDGREVNRIVGYRPRKDLTAAIDGAL